MQRQNIFHYLRLTNIISNLFSTQRGRSWSVHPPLFLSIGRAYDSKHNLSQLTPSTFHIQFVLTQSHHWVVSLLLCHKKWHFSQLCQNVKTSSHTVSLPTSTQNVLCSNWSRNNYSSSSPACKTSYSAYSNHHSSPPNYLTWPLFPKPNQSSCAIYS